VCWIPDRPIYVLDESELINRVNGKVSGLQERATFQKGMRPGRDIGGVYWRMVRMTERRTARRYDLSLPIIIRVPTERALDTPQGKTRDISTRGLYFVVEQNFEAGSTLDITLTLPAEITHGTEVFVRAFGKVVRVENRSENGDNRMGVAAVIERYDIIRGEAARA
jgi:hypothetical protein